MTVPTPSAPARASVERKVKWSAAAAYVTSAAGVAVLQLVQADESLVAPLPDLVEAPLLALVPALLTFAAGYRARHTPRSDAAALD
jgi:hypothetical protein